MTNTGATNKIRGQALSKTVNLSTRDTSTVFSIKSGKIVLALNYIIYVEAGIVIILHIRE